MNRLLLALSAIVVGLVVSSCAVGVRQPATNITKTSATLNGNVLSTTGGPGSWYIEYGQTVARSEKTPTRTIDFEVNEIEPASEPVGGLEPGTTYHFAVCAEDSENPGEPFCSPDQTFRTKFDGDSVVGSGTTSGGFDVAFDIDAHSGPAGENPTGTASLERLRYPFTSLRGRVTCLNVTGNRAVIGVENSLGSEPAAGALLEVWGGPGDTLGVEFLDAVPTLCPAPLDLFPNPVALGDIEVSDAQPAPSPN